MYSSFKPDQTGAIVLTIVKIRTDKDWLTAINSIEGKSALTKVVLIIHPDYGTLVTKGSHQWFTESNTKYWDQTVRNNSMTAAHGDVCANTSGPKPRACAISRSSVVYPGQFQLLFIRKTKGLESYIFNKPHVTLFNTETHRVLINQQTNKQINK